MRSSEDKWISSAGTRIGKLDKSSHTFGVGDVDIRGADWLPV